MRALAPFSLDSRDADLLLPLYVTALCARFLPDSLTEHGQQLRSTVDGLLDLLERLLGAGPTRTVAAASTPKPTRAQEVRR